MSNVFAADDAHEGEPTSFVGGDFIQWKRSDLVDDYPVTTHSMEYVARRKGGTTDEIRVSGIETDTTTYLFRIQSVDSAAFVSGEYAWQLEVTETSSGNRAVIDTGTWKIIADLDVDSADTRTHAQIMVAKIESILEGKADSDVANYAIGGRSLTKMTFDELMTARDKYKAEITAEIAKTKAVNPKSTVKVYF